MFFSYSDCIGQRVQDKTERFFKKVNYIDTTILIMHAIPLHLPFFR